mmetsp:Transcript_7983/g.13714  ORF Transcript_7983/g.13714 Transcript_7983/m.13714 type:complete len:94 (+) Transcript_7983:147-428(+)
MILPGGGSRLQTLGGLAAQLFDSTLRTLFHTNFLFYFPHGAENSKKQVAFAKCGSKCGTTFQGREDSPRHQKNLTLEEAQKQQQATAKLTICS